MSLRVTVFAMVVATQACFMPGVQWHLLRQPGGAGDVEHQRSPGAAHVAAPRYGAKVDSAALDQIELGRLLSREDGRL